MKEFLNFIRGQGVVGLAIGFILGGSINKVISSLVSDIIQPLIGLVLGSAAGLNAVRIGPVLFGHFLTVLIDFIIVAAVVFFLFKKMRLDRLDKKVELKT
ncbi:MscL family protein [Patescibacteria group bacterium]|nr:MscL family protein [Patescibacteria group bacterium]MBU1028866.1 MscL family protein [Patescibacteria group bacterium]MBU1915641.1 MscL family protein [Patescibacteria group bacterium]